MSVLAGFILPHPPIIIPEIGKGDEKKIQKTTDAYNRAAEKIAELEPDTIVITSPHSICYYDYFHISPGSGACGDFYKFSCPEVKVSVNYDIDFVRELSDFCSKENIQAGTLGEKDSSLDHGTMIPLYFILKYLKNFKAVRIGLSGLPSIENYRLGQAISNIADRQKKKVVIVASGDLSHCLKKDGPYGYHEEGPEFDRQIIKAVEKGNFLSFFGFDEDFLKQAEECGLGSFQIMAGCLDKKAFTPKLYSYQDTFGVGYGVAAFEARPSEETESLIGYIDRKKNEYISERRAKEDIYVKFARDVVETFVRTNDASSVFRNIPKELTGSKAGVFVSIKTYPDRLRGCIGTTSACYKNIGEEIIHNGVAACSEDPRFDKVKVSELEGLIYSVDVLSPFVKVKDKSKLDPKKDGVIVRSGHKTGLLLPDLDGIDTADQQIMIASKKAGISEGEEVELYTFTSTRHL